MSVSLITRPSDDDYCAVHTVEGLVKTRRVEMRPKPRHCVYVTEQLTTFVRNQSQSLSQRLPEEEKTTRYQHWKGKEVRITIPQTLRMIKHNLRATIVLNNHIRK